MRSDYLTAAAFLKEHDNYAILTHKSPDGDALGSGFALCHLLRSMNKRARVITPDGVPARYAFLSDNAEDDGFEEETVIAVDIADVKLLGSAEEKYAERVELCIDHHLMHREFAKMTLLEAEASAAAVLIFKLCPLLGVEPDDFVAKCLYTAIATDTGCFKFGNTTPETHRIAAALMEHSFDFETINREMFDLKSPERIKLECALAMNVHYHLDGRCSFCAVTHSFLEEVGVDSDDLEGLTSISLQAEGVLVGITAREREPKCFKLSFRSPSKVNVAEICAAFGGGGHKNAAGCELTGSLEEVERLAVEAVAKQMAKEL